MSLVPAGMVGIGLATIAAASVACTSLGVRVGMDRGRTMDALVVVLLCNLLILLPVTAVLYYPEYGVSLRSAIAFVAAGLTGTLLGRLCYFNGISLLGSSRTEPIKATQPLHGSVIAVIVLGETVTALQLVGILLIVLGVGSISWETSREPPGGLSSEDAAKGVLLGIGAAFFFGIEPIWAKIGLADGTPVLVGLVFRMVIAAAAFLGYLRARNQLPSTESLTRSNMRWYVAAGIANTLFLIAYYASLQTAPVTVVLPIVQTSPLLVVVLSGLFLPTRLERISWPLVVGAITVVVGAVFVTLFS
jgi:drug/metabolite transporter (DMT)-like permease